MESTYDKTFRSQQAKRTYEHRQQELKAVTSKNLQLFT
jgi:hypothetical protein